MEKKVLVIPVLKMFLRNRHYEVCDEKSGA